ncbi:protein FAR1-RELATED SEQUENCE 5-like [Morus notabilis]|uniref:protein FAR1-RELATED SEQUENCE 5-like n=1 Tax=Morus notabilis TaxID=981085 RepID=UPI000CED7625|nr:protein FAR1-RELATED SEQUENCE 5-like [Morus notabilis]
MEWQDFCTTLVLTKTAWDLLPEDLLGKELDTEELWNNFYKLYSKHIGFSYRKDSTRKEKDGERWGRRWCCSRQGFRRRKWLELEHRSRAAASETRCGCEASIRVIRSKTTNKWVCRHFNPNHNHECASPQEIRFLRSNRNVTDDVVARCESMKRAGMKNVQIIDFIALESGGHDKLPFLEKDIHNKLMRVRNAKDQHQNITDSDGMLGYIRCLARNHGEDFYCVYNADEENRLCNIMWSDGVSMRDYAVFGDVVAFNTTYRTNKYHKPLLLLVGVNNHWRTIVFGIALLLDETVDTFVWVLQMFLQGMNNWKPKVVVTDGDNAMKNAIAQVFPESKHRLCGWHLMENVANNVKDINFKRDFKEIMYRYYSKPEFLDRWHSLILAYELENNY